MNSVIQLNNCTEKVTIHRMKKKNEARIKEYAKRIKEAAKKEEKLSTNK